MSKKADGKDMGMDGLFELCVGRDQRGQLRKARVPAGVGRRGMFLRLVGGAFLMVETVEPYREGHGFVPAAAEALESVWRCGIHG